MADNILEVRNLKKYFYVGGQVVRAVDNVSFAVRRGETFGLTGESGCGKSTVARTIVRLYDTTAGEVLFDGENVHRLKGKRAKRLSRDLQMVFQDPYSSLNPRMTAGDIIAEGIDIHRLLTGSRRRERVHELLRTVGLNEEHASRFPHEFSGGQRQRIGIARALAVDPRFIILDEPVSALDVSIRAQIVGLLKKLQSKRGLTYLLIAHDLTMLRHIADRIGVMYLGSLVEIAGGGPLFRSPLHPYTQTLLSVIPVPDPDLQLSRKRVILQGEVPSPLNPPNGCRFRTRCPQAMPECACLTPELREVETGHFVACHLYSR